ncbi:MAG: hypothetical protein A2Y17_01565 [Clostridiales bacterium GWF2_38_85]|nr:MAG: hypothetical protein A2Y17_01565 [Clostridiales bacterium GWF2_38_85]HBL84804.1 type II secretion pathway protein XcpS [Clostridiales bacterium]
MPAYKYTAKDISGKTIHGTAKAESNSALMTTLSDNQLFLVKATELSTESNKSKLTSNELAEFSKEIGTMLSVGVSLVRAINIIMNRDNTPKLKKVYIDLYQALKKGNAFSDALRLQGSTFSELFINMIIAGEASGQLDKTILKMSTYYEKESRLNSKLKNAMTYPIILFIITVLIVIIIFTFVMPNFLSTFENMELPLPTKIVLAISDVMTNYWYVILSVVLLIVVVFAFLMQREEFRIFIDKRKLRVPKIKKFLKIIYTARFARTISALYSSGLSLVSSVQTGQAIIGNRYISAQFDNVLYQVKVGISLSKAITKIDGFDTKLASVIQIGEETGKLADMLTSIADSYDYESEIAAQRMIVILEPVMLIFMALVIGSVMLSVLMPILQMYQGI